MPSAAVYEAAAEFRARLLARERTAASAMVRFYGEAWARIRADMLKLSGEVEALRASGVTVTEAQIMRLERMQAIEAQVKSEMLRFSEYADGEISARMREAIAAGERDAYTITQLAFPRDAGVAVTFYRMPREAVEAYVGFMQDGTPLRKLLEQYVGDAAQALSETLVTGLAAGFNPRQVAREARKRFGMGLTESLRLARTEQLRAYRTATLESYKANGDIVKGWRRLAAKDSRTCAACLILDGKEYSTQEEMDDHPNGRCHPGWVLTSGAFPVAASERHYTGKLVTVRTATGIELSFTPNHPVLTPSGWVAGGLLHEGDDVVCGSFGKDAAATVNVDDNDMPASIKEIAESFGVVAAEVPTAPEDFHGDGEGSKVHIVRANGLLWDNGQAAIFEPAFQHDLGNGDVGLPSLPSGSDLAPMFQGLMGAPRGGLRDTDASEVFLNGSAVSQQSVGSRLVPELHASLKQAGADSGTRDAESLGNGVLGFARAVERGNLSNGQLEHGQLCVGHPAGGQQIASFLVTEQSAGNERVPESVGAGVKPGCGVFDALPSDISIDRVVEVSIRAFTGHVYSLQTREGWYIASDSIPHNDGVHKGIITHNCALVPITKTYAEMGIDAPEPQYQPESGREWFDRQDEATQRKILGTGRYDAWKAGAFELEDIPHKTHDPVWGDSWTPRPLYDLLGQSAPVGTYQGWLAGQNIGTLTPALLSNEVSVVNAYADTMYRVVNPSLRGMEVDERLAHLFPRRDETISVLDDALAKAAAPENMTVWRGSRDNFLAGIDRGGEFLDRGFVSTTLDEAKAGKFATGGATDPTLVRVNVPRGYSALSLETYTGTGESEVLLRRNSTFRIVDVGKMMVDRYGKRIEVNYYVVDLIP